MDVFKGPLGSHRNYIVYVALENCQDYYSLKKKHAEKNIIKTPAKYKEMRYFLNAIESVNNILDYYYYENEDSISYSSLIAFRKAIHKKYSQLKDIADLANGYKHCVREYKGNKNASLPWARDLQNPKLNVDINLGKGMLKVAYDFQWPLDENEEKLTKAFQFWFEYINDQSSKKLKEA